MEFYLETYSLEANPCILFIIIVPILPICTSKLKYKVLSNLFSFFSGCSPIPSSCTPELSCLLPPLFLPPPEEGWPIASRHFTTTNQNSASSPLPPSSLLVQKKANQWHSAFPQQLIITLLLLLLEAGLFSCIFHDFSKVKIFSWPLTDNTEVPSCSKKMVNVHNSVQKRGLMAKIVQLNHLFHVFTGLYDVVKAAQKRVLLNLPFSCPIFCC